jgi:hypothetical protein
MLPVCDSVMKRLRQRMGERQHSPKDGVELIREWLRQLKPVRGGIGRWC